MILIHHLELSNTCFARQTEQDGRFDNGKAKLGGISALIYGRFYILQKIYRSLRARSVRRIKNKPYFCDKAYQQKYGLKKISLIFQKQGSHKYHYTWCIKVYLWEIIRIQLWYTKSQEIHTEDIRRAVVAAALAIILAAAYQDDPVPENTSILTGDLYFREITDNPNESNFLHVTWMDKLTFERLLRLTQDMPFHGSHLLHIAECVTTSKSGVASRISHRTERKYSNFGMHR